MYRKIPSVFVVLLMTAGLSSAQPKSAGISFCFSGTGISYEHSLADGNFLEMMLKTETSEAFLGHKGGLGGSASFTWNIVFKEWQTVDGCPVRMFAGPGVAIGFGPDYKAPPGLFYGLKGRFGVEFLSRRGVCVSACIAPVLGQHIIWWDDAARMKYYRNGLLYGLAPEIGIRYIF